MKGVGLFYGRVGWILGGGGTDSGSVAYSCRKVGYILEGRFWERHFI